MAIQTYCGLFAGINGQNQQQGLIQEQKSSLDWNIYPVVLSMTELKTLHESHLLAILNKNLQSPSQMVAEGYVEPCSLIRIIDKEHHDALSGYEKELKVASEADAAEIENLRIKHGWITNSFSMISLAMGEGLIFTKVLKRKSRFSLISSPFMEKAALFCGVTAAGYYCGTKALNLYLAYHGSSHRIAWLKKVNESEKKRLANIKEQLQKSYREFNKELEKLEKTGESDCEAEESIRQITQLFQKLFPDEGFF